MQDARIRDRAALTLHEFTNLKFVGTGFLWKPELGGKKISINPNVMAFWNEHATKKYDLAAGEVSATEYARNFLGVEVNASVVINLIENLKMSLNCAVFAPGSYYDDIKGTPLTNAQAKLISGSTAADRDTLPLLGTNAAYTLGMSLAYDF